MNTTPGKPTEPTKRPRTKNKSQDVAPLSEFDKTMRGISGTSKVEVDQEQRRQKQRAKKVKSKNK